VKSVPSPRHLEPWRRIWGPRTLKLSHPFAFYWCRHFFAQPYRRQLSREPIPRTFRRRARIAAYDSVMNLIIDGYSEQVAHKIHDMTGPLVIVFNRVVGAFDDEFEQRLERGRPTAFEDVLNAESVSARMQEMRRFLEPYSTARNIHAFLDDWVARQYGRYLELMKNSRTAISIQDCVEAAAIDSGGFATCIANVIGLFHNEPPSDNIIRQFANLGIIGKFADDMVDFWADDRNERVNLLDTFARQYPNEYSRTRVVLGHVPRTGLRWWARNCPQALADFSNLLAEYTSQLNVPRLQLAAGTILLPAMWGRAMVKPEPVNLRL
jgi:hypothetical protein